MSVKSDESNEIHIFIEDLPYCLTVTYVHRASNSDLSPIRHFPKSFPVTSVRHPHGFVSSA